MQIASLDKNDRVHYPSLLQLLGRINRQRRGLTDGPERFFIIKY